MNYESTVDSLIYAADSLAFGSAKLIQHNRSHETRVFHLPLPIFTLFFRSTKDNLSFTTNLHHPNFPPPSPPRITFTQVTYVSTRGEGEISSIHGGGGRGGMYSQINATRLHTGARAFECIYTRVYFPHRMHDSGKYGGGGS